MLLHRYNITGPERDKILESQSNSCKICNSNINPRLSGHTKRDAAVVDHCHKSGVIRGILCGQCNVGLGSFQDNPVALRIAADYLEISHSRR